MKASTFDFLVVGAGAAGMMAAITAARLGKNVLLLEKNDRPCRKVYITGKGRCNVTNNCTAAECLENIPRNPKFLHTALAAFSPADTMAFFENLGCPLKVERGNRVFPASDQAASIIDALREESRRLGITFLSCTVTKLLRDGAEISGVDTDKGPFFCKKVLLATGGASYPRTGSTGDGYKLAQEVGHTVTPIEGSLVPLTEQGSFCGNMAGLTLKNITLKLKDGAGKTVYEDFGEAEFTADGLSGATVLSASAHMRAGADYTVILDLKPALSEEKLDARLLRELSAQKNASMDCILGKLLPRVMISPILHRAEIPISCRANELTKERRKKLLFVLKNLEIPIAGKRPIEEAIITSGGVSVKEVSPKTMESKLVKGLYFAGEILDADAYTGGFNLQIAWATGHAAGVSAAE